MSIAIEYPAVSYRYSGRIRRRGMESSRTIERCYVVPSDTPRIIATKFENAMALDNALAEVFLETYGHDVCSHHAAWLTDTEIRAAARRAGCLIQ